MLDAILLGLLRNSMHVMTTLALGRDIDIVNMHIGLWSSSNSSVVSSLVDHQPAVHVAVYLVLCRCGPDYGVGWARSAWVG